MRQMERFAAVAAATASLAAAAPALAGAEECTPAQQKAFIESHIGVQTRFDETVLDPPGTKAVVEVSPKQDPGDFMVNPFAIRYHGHIADYAALTNRGGKTHIEMLAADKAQVVEYIGHRATHIRHPGALVAERTLHWVKPHGDHPPAFTDGKEAFAVEP